jgi:pyruvate/2-oxoglutarate/acetoin dehydrogenase E1 component
MSFAVLISCIGLAIGYSSMSGGTAIGEIQFADYIFPGKNHIVPYFAAIYLCL